MNFYFNDFLVKTKKEIETLHDTFIKPIYNKNDRLIEHREVPKTREFTTFDTLYIRTVKTDVDYGYRIILKDLFELIDLIELFQAFSNKKLAPKTPYNFKNFTANLTQKDGITYLKINYTIEGRTLFYTAFEATTIASKLKKIVSKCEAWQE